MKILILCTGNSCRSQMAEGLLKSFDSRLEVYSAGTNPAYIANPNAVMVMKTGGRFCVSDVVIKGNLPNALKEDAVMYAGYVSGALQMENYLGIIEKTGFKNITVHKQKPITIPDETLKKYLSPGELDEFKKGGTGIFSITVSANKN